VVEESHFGDVGYHRTDNSESGWTTGDTFRQWLAWLSGVYDDNQATWLILDYYAVRRQEAMKQYAAKLGINFLFIPAGLTDELQPLECFVFGAMKANCHRMPRVQVAEEGVMSKQAAASFLIRAWEGVSTAVFDEDWAIYEGFDPDED
jgi:hypothetical protein